MAAKIPVVINKVNVKKTFNAKATKAAAGVVAAALATAIGKSGKLNVVKKVGDKDKGFSVIATVHEIKCDEKNKTISAKMSTVLSKLPGPFIVGSTKGTSSVSGINLKKIENDVKFLLSTISKDQGGEAKKILEGKIKIL